MNDRISALMDGEVDEKSAAQLIEALARDAEAIRTWRSYHLIGDAMRGERPLSAGFGARLAARMATEPTVLAPRRSTRRVATYALSAAFWTCAIGAGATCGCGAKAIQPTNATAATLAARADIVNKRGDSVRRRRGASTVGSAASRCATRSVKRSDRSMPPRIASPIR